MELDQRQKQSCLRRAATVASFHVRYNVYVKEKFMYTHFVTLARRALQDNYHKHVREFIVP